MGGLDGGIHMEKEKSFGSVLLVRFFGVFGKKRIVGCSKISELPLNIFELLFTIQPPDGVQITPTFFEITVF